ncbi:MAG: GNAT family N-acetyltransferase, partial [Acidimicrobiales bacterium]
MIVRDVRPEELDTAAAVMVAAYEEYAPFMPAESWGRYRGDIADVQGRLEATELIVAELGGRIVGAVTFYPDAARYGTRVEAAPWPKGWSAIRLLAVHPEARRRGIGRALAMECLRRAREREAAAVVLHTASGMAAARGMYERMGFERVPEFDHRPAPEVNVIAYR